MLDKNSSERIQELEGDSLNRTLKLIKPFIEGHWPFLYLISDQNIGYSIKDGQEIKSVVTRGGWELVNHGDAISAIALSEGEINPSIGINPVREVNQYRAAVKAIEIALENGWTGLGWAGGTELVGGYLWVEAKRRGLEMEGYQATLEDERRYELLKRYPAIWASTWEPQPEVEDDEDIELEQFL